jgi:hypothetical protein
LVRRISADAPGDFFSQLRGLFRSVSTYGFSTAHPLSGCDRQPLLAPSRPLLYYYFVKILTGAGAEPLPEREVSSHHPSFYFVPPQAAQNKNALHPFAVKDEERHIALAVPPSFIDASRHQPRRVLTYSRPITGAAGRGLLSRQAISSRSSRVFFTVCRRMGFPALTHSLDATGNCYSPLQGFCSMQL